MHSRLQNAPKELTPSAAVMQATAIAGDMLGLTKIVSATAGTRKATVWSRFRTFVTDRPCATSPSANQPTWAEPVGQAAQAAACHKTVAAGRSDCEVAPAAELPTAMTVQGSRERNALDLRSNFSTYACSRLTHAVASACSVFCKQRQHWWLEL